MEDSRRGREEEMDEVPLITLEQSTSGGCHSLGEHKRFLGHGN